MVALHDARSSPHVFWWEGDILVPALYNISKYLIVEDTFFPPSYAPIDMQARLVDWGKFDTIKLDSLDEQTVEVVLLRQSVHVAPTQGSPSHLWIQESLK